MRAAKYLKGDDILDYYIFNKFEAASIGEIPSKSEYQFYNSTLASELCSSHFSDVSKDIKLTWINFSVSYCKKNDLAKDLFYFPYKSMGEVALEKMYEGSLCVRLTIVPSQLPRLRPANRPRDLTKEKQVYQDFVKRKLNRMKDVDRID